MFCEALEFGELNGIYTKWPKFTWTNNIRDNGFTKEKLNRVVANMEWQQSFSDSLCTILTVVRSDHYPFFIVAERKETNMRNNAFFFRYETSWILKEES